LTTKATATERRSLRAGDAGERDGKVDPRRRRLALIVPCINPIANRQAGSAAETGNSEQSEALSRPETGKREAGGRGRGRFCLTANR
jgi:hypothetical protein